MLIVCKVCTKIVQVLRYPGHMQKHKEKSQLKGKIKIEDAGFDWKITGPDVTDVDFVAYTCD